MQSSYSKLQDKCPALSSWHVYLALVFLMLNKHRMWPLNILLMERQGDGNINIKVSWSYCRLYYLVGYPLGDIITRLAKEYSLTLSMWPKCFFALMFTYSTSESATAAVTVSPFICSKFKMEKTHIHFPIIITIILCVMKKTCEVSLRTWHTP